MRGHLSIFAANVLFGISLPVFKYLLSADFPPEAIAWMRAGFACCAFWVVSLFLPREKVAAKDLLLLMVCGLCGVGFNQWVFVVAMRLSSPVDLSVIGTAVPMFVLMLSAIFLGERITRRKSLGIAVGAAGALLFIATGSAGQVAANGVLGDLLQIMNCVMFAVHLVLSRPLATRYSSVTMMKWMFLFSAIALAPFCVGSLPSVPLFQSGSFSWLHLAAVVYLLFFATFLAFMLVSKSLHFISPSTASIYNYVQPIVASVIAIIIGQDVFSWRKLFAALLVFVGVWLVTQNRKKTASQAFARVAEFRDKYKVVY